MFRYFEDNGIDNRPPYLERGDEKTNLRISNGLTNPAFENGSDIVIDQKVDQTNGPPPKERARWGNSLEFLMSCIAMSVGLGNIWRFPFAAYENGGGAFLIPYLIVLVVVGRPVYYLEMCLGQFTSRGNVQMFGALAPAIKGMGYGQLVAAMATATYYSAIMALTLYYLFSSFSTVLPWTVCKEEWTNLTCIPSNQTGNGSKIGYSISSSELFLSKEVLNEKSQIDDGLGVPEWKLVICLLVAWVLTFAVTMKGVKSSGKVAYFLAIFPYVVLITLLVRAVTLEGSAEGIMYFIRPQWEKLKEVKVWYAAIVQCFFSLTVGFGTITMYSSYNSFEHNVHRDALIVSIMDTFTSLLAGATIFGILGNLAYKSGVDIKHVLKSGGASLAFISYPEAIAKFETVPWLFAILFFFMLFTLGIGSLVSLQSCALTVIKDSFPQAKSWCISAGLATGCFLIGLVYVTPGGQFMVTMVDHYGGTFILFILTTIEVALVVWWYGVDNFCLDIEYMLKRKVGCYWRICWGIVTPTVMIVVLVYFIYQVETLKHNNVEFPTAAEAFGWAILVLGVLQPLIWWLVYLVKNRKIGVKHALEDSLSHSKWGPKDEHERKEWMSFKEQVQMERLARNRSFFERTIDLFLRS